MGRNGCWWCGALEGGLFSCYERSSGPQVRPFIESTHPPSHQLNHPIRHPPTHPPTHPPPTRDWDRVDGLMERLLKEQQDSSTSSTQRFFLDMMTSFVSSGRWRSALHLLRVLGEGGERGGGGGGEGEKLSAAFYEQAVQACAVAGTSTHPPTHPPIPSFLPPTQTLAYNSSFKPPSPPLPNPPTHPPTHPPPPPPTHLPQ